jgi:hypothetical protein
MYTNLHFRQRLLESKAADQLPPFPEDQLLLTTFAKGGLLDTQYPVVNYKSKVRQVLNEQRFCASSGWLGGFLR